MEELRQQFLPEADFCGIIINSSLDGGTAYFNRPSGNIVLVTLEDTEALPHELGHAVAKLADEYDEKGYYGYFEAPNAMREPVPVKVSWARHIGMDDISVYSFAHIYNWFHPSKNCMMRSTDAGRFCRVCEDVLREYIGKYCTGSRLLFARLRRTDSGIEDWNGYAEYFSVQKEFKTLANSRIPEALLLLKYYDEDGNVINGLPRKAGSYFVEAEFLGYQYRDTVFVPCILKVSIEIKSDSAKVFWLSVAPLLMGTAVWIAWLKLTVRRNRFPVDL